MSKIASDAGLHDELIDQVVAQREPGDLLDQRLVLAAEDVQFAADVLDVVFQQHDALGSLPWLVSNSYRSSRSSSFLWIRSSRSAMIDRRWASSSPRLTVVAVSASKVSV